MSTRTPFSGSLVRRLSVLTAALRALLLMTAAVAATPATCAADPEPAAAVREAHSKELVAVFDDVAQFQQGVVRTIDTLKAQRPNTAASFWAELRETVDSRNFEQALARHYLASFTGDEMQRIATFFEAPELRAAMSELRALGEKHPQGNFPPGEMDRVRARIGDARWASLIDFCASPLWQKIVTVQRASQPIRRSETISALAAAQDRLKAK